MGPEEEKHIYEWIKTFFSLFFNCKTFFSQYFAYGFLALWKIPILVRGVSDWNSDIDHQAFGGLSNTGERVAKYILLLQLVNFQTRAHNLKSHREANHPDEIYFSTFTSLKFHSCSFLSADTMYTFGSSCAQAPFPDTGWFFLLVRPKND